MVRDHCSEIWGKESSATRSPMSLTAIQDPWLSSIGYPRHCFLRRFLLKVLSRARSPLADSWIRFSIGDLVPEAEQSLHSFMKLEGKTVLITGGGQGIGQGIAFRLAEEGADIVIDYVGNSAAADATVAQIKKGGRRALAVEADISSVDQIHAMMKQAVDSLGGIDILVNNAGVEKHASIWEATERDYDLVLNINLKGAFFASQAFVQHRMAAKKPGKIINVSSVHEELPFPHFTSYCASKGGMKMMMRNLSIELAPYGITVNNIAPGAIETPINTALLNDPSKLKALLSNIPLNRLGQVNDVAGVAVFLASSDSDYITGTTIVVDGGLTWNYSEQ
jgi:glucose 1-dehydrogenase